MRSRVAYKGCKSDWFDILQGSRQGGVLSPFLYLCFTDDLLEELCKCPASLNISNMDLAVQPFVTTCFLHHCRKEDLMN